MDYVSPFVQPITSCLWDPLMKQTSHLVKAKSNIMKMSKSMQALNDCRDDLQKEIEDAEREQKQSTNEMKSWLERVGAIEAQVDKIKTQYESRGCRPFGYCSLNCCSTYKLGKEAAALFDEMVQLKAQRGASIATRQPLGHNMAIPTTSTVLGLDPYIKMVRDYLFDDNIGVIGIYGMGGVGKTTLLREINNSLLREGNLGFKYQLWVVVSKDFQLTKVQTQIAENLNLRLTNKDDAEQNARIIFNYLKDKNFLLMLDDLWKGFDIARDVGIPYTNCSSDSNNQTKRRQKVILTSRFEQVCGRMCTDKLIKVECLDKEDARNLFKKTLGEWYLKANPGIHRLVEEVVDECGRLPLALVVIAQAMSTRKTVQGWQAARESLKKLSQEGKLLGEDLHLFPTLKFSYDNLKNDALRKCFLFCSLWPEDRHIFEESITEFCIGNELITNFDTITEACDMGHLLIEDLKGACLLESSGTNGFKMHDVLRDLSIWIASDCGKNQNRWLVKAGIGLREVQSEVRKWKGAHAVSLMDNDVEEVSPVPFECPNMAFLMLQGNRGLRKIDPSIFQYMHNLTSLSLRGTDLHELPESIGMLTMLLYLDLGGGTKVHSLPKGLGNLTRLRYLNLAGMNFLKCIPAGVISSLVELQLLDLRWSNIDEILIRGPEADENDVEQSKEISSKKGSLIDEVEQLPRGLKGFGVGLQLLKDFQHLSNLSRVFTLHLILHSIEDLTTIHLKRNMWCSLESLTLYGCREAMELVFVVDEGMSNDTCPIKYLDIDWLEGLKEIIFRGVVPSMFFPRLQRVTIENCGRLNNINWILGLPSLAELSVVASGGIECLVDDLLGKESADKDFFFPALRSLSLDCLLDLRCICRPIPRINLLALETLYVRNCPNLKEIPLPANNDGLRITCDQQWWDGLEVEESIKNSLKAKVSFYY